MEMVERLGTGHLVAHLGNDLRGLVIGVTNEAQTPWNRPHRCARPCDRLLQAVTGYKAFRYRCRRRDSCRRD